MLLRTNYHKTVNPRSLMVKVDQTAATIKDWIEKNGPISHLVCTGVSGQSVAWPVGYKLGIPVCVVRKPGEDSHDADNVTGKGNLLRYLLIDDFIRSGNTIRRVLKELDNYTPPSWKADSHVPPECAGIVLYNTSKWERQDAGQRIFQTDGKTYPVIPTSTAFEDDQ